LKTTSIVVMSLALAACAPSLEPGEMRTYSRAFQWDQESGTKSDDQGVLYSDYVYCLYFTLDNASKIHVDQMNVQFLTGKAQGSSHHFHIYRLNSGATPDGNESMVSCNGKTIDWSKYSLVFGVQSDSLDWHLPDGITAPFDAHQQFVIQVHWLNDTTAKIHPEVQVNFHATPKSEMDLGVAFGIAKDVWMDPGSPEKHVGGWTALPAGSKLIAMMGHFHKHGDTFDVDVRKSGDATGNNIYHSVDGEQNLLFKQWTPSGAPRSPEIGAGEGLAYDCYFHNPDLFALTWGPDTQHQEHCNMAAYYAPADPTANTVRLSGDLGTISPISTVIMGLPTTTSVTLAEPAGALPVQVIAKTDPQMHGDTIAFGRVLPWQTSGTLSFIPKALGTMKATATTGHVDAQHLVQLPPIDVEPLALSEAYYETSGTQWVEIANLSSSAVDLSQYTLGAGTQRFTENAIRLSGTIAPLGAAGGGWCVVVQIGAPGLPVGVGANASGVGLFHAAAIDDKVAPYDAIYYGAGDAHIALPVAVGPAPKIAGNVHTLASLERSPDGGWREQLAPTKSTCNVANAP
jgi:hypothetical protein